MGTYTFTKQVPLKLFLGLFNGSGINNPSWNNKINIIGRVEFGRAEGFRAAASYYNGSAPRHAFVVERDGVSSQEELNQKMNMVEPNFITSPGASSSKGSMRGATSKRRWTTTIF